MRRAALLLCSLTLTLAACQTERQAALAPSLPPQQQMPVGVEGDWRSVGGPVAYDARFQNGRFTSAESATNGLLAEGAYTNTGPGQIQINYRSIQRNQQLAANCNHAGGQMTCTAADGSSFSLTRG
jgi:hypothetical protein